MSPTALLVLIAIVLAVLGTVLYRVQRLLVFRGYRDIAEDVQRIAATIRATVARDSGDLMLAGEWAGCPALIRFSHSMNMPGMHIEVRVPATFNFSLTPKNVTASGGRLAIRTGSDPLDARFTARTDHPMQTRMLLGSKNVLGALEKLCCSTHTDFAIKTGNMELSELSIPNYVARHVQEHLQSMEAVARLIQEMPGAGAVKVQPVRKPGTSWTIRIALATGLLAVVVLLFMQPHSAPGPRNVTASAPPGALPPADAERLPNILGWHIAQPADFSPSAAQFLQDHQMEAVGHVTGDFEGKGNDQDSGYLLVDAKGQRRVSLLSGGSVAYDSIFPKAEVIAVVPHEDLPSIQWIAAPQFDADGDALLVIGDFEDSSSGIILVRHGQKTYSARPADFTRIDLGSY